MKMKKMELQRYFIPIIGSVIGLIVFWVIYGFAPLNVKNDSWIMQGYDEADIIQHYAGWCAFRNSKWHYPLGMVDTMAAGSYISFTDSIPLVAIVSKLLLSIAGYTGTFQYFGVYTLLCYILQAIGAGLIIKRKTNDRLYILLSMVLLCFSPVLMERAMRHTALGSQWLILFAIYAFLKCKDSRYQKYPADYYVLSVLAITIHPYFLPLVMIFAFVSGVNGILHTRRYIFFLGCFLGNIGCAFLSGLILGVLGTGISASRGGYGYFSMNLNAVINPMSLGGYTWSSFLKLRPQILGNYDGFNYLGAGVLVLLAVCVVYFIICKKINGIFQENWVYVSAMLFMFLFAISNVITLNDRQLTIQIPQELVELGGIFRASSRMFYAVYYSIFVFLLNMVVQCFDAFLGEGEERRLAVYNIVLSAVVLLQLFDLHSVILEKHAAMKVKCESRSILDDRVLTERLGSYSYFAASDWNVYIAACVLKNGLNTYLTVANSGDFSAGMADNNRHWAELYRGNHDMATVFGTGDRRRAELVAEINDDMILHENDGYYFMFPQKESAKNLENYFCSALTDDNWTDGVSNYGQEILFEYTDELLSKIQQSRMILAGDTEINIVSVNYDASWIRIGVDENAKMCAFPAVFLFR